MGDSQMPNTLIFMAYTDASGRNVTLSPRLSTGYAEPVYTPDVPITILPGTSVVNGTFKVNAKCRKCRSWASGSIDPSNAQANFIYASGPSGSINSNSVKADIKRHSSYGSFFMDLTKAVGPAGIPDQVEVNTAGSGESSSKMDRRNIAGAVHAVVMILTFVGLLPLGVLVLRVFKSPKWHGVLQGLSLALAVVGMIIGILMGRMYNRVCLLLPSLKQVRCVDQVLSQTKNFNTPHQIIGVIVMAGLIGQFAIGFLHHRAYTKSKATTPTSSPSPTPSTTKLAPIHIWLGRSILFLGIMNGFLGFPLALNPKLDLALLSVVLFVLIVFGPFAFWRFRRDLKKKKEMGGASDADDGYQSQPWVGGAAGGQSRSNIELGQMQFPPPYQGHPATQGRQFV